MEQRPLDQIIKDETLEKLVDLLRSFGKNDGEIEEGLTKDLGLSRQRLAPFLNLEGPSDSSGR